MTLQVVDGRLRGRMSRAVAPSCAQPGRLGILGYCGEKGYTEAAAADVREKRRHAGARPE